MSFMEKLSAGAEKAAKEAEKAFDKGKAKVGELQIEMKMDSKAKKLGYLVFDFSRGRPIDQEERQRLIDELTVLEEQLIQARAEAAARKKQAQSGGQTAGPGAHQTPPADTGQGPDAAETAGGQATTPPSENEGSWPQADA